MNLATVIEINKRHLTARSHQELIHSAETYHSDRETLKKFYCKVKNARSWFISKVKGYELK
jgi:hypothetical protein